MQTFGPVWANMNGVVAERSKNFHVFSNAFLFTNFLGKIIFFHKSKRVLLAKKF